MTSNAKRFFSALSFVLLAASAADAAGSRCPRLRVIGLTSDQHLVAFRACKPGRVRDIGRVSGLGGGDSALVGIDFRVQDGALYGVGNGGGVYSLDETTGEARFVSQLSVALEGTAFGVDFNPAANRLRVVSDTGQNLRHDVSVATGGTTPDAALTYTTPPTAPVAATGITASAYTNNDATAMSPPNTGTTLFELDTNLNQLTLQSPPNNGILVATGQLGVDPGPAAGFDVYTALGLDGMAADNLGLAVLSVGGAPALYGIELLTGEASRIGALGAPVVDLAIPLNQ
jgi:hypothetical protein